MKQIYEMANLTREESGQPFDLWINSAGKARNTKHNEPRVKASNNGVRILAGFKNGEYTNFNTPKDNIRKFGKNTELKEYLIKIKSLLELHWENKITDTEFLLIANLVKQGYEVLNAVNKACEILQK